MRTGNAVNEMDKSVTENEKDVVIQVLVKKDMSTVCELFDVLEGEVVRYRTKASDPICFEGKIAFLVLWNQASRSDLSKVKECDLILEGMLKDLADECSKVGIEDKNTRDGMLRILAADVIKSELMDAILGKIAKNEKEEVMQYIKEKNYVVVLWSQTLENNLYVVKQNGGALQYVIEQTPEICLEAVKRSGLALEYVKEQTSEICLEAVRSYGYALKYVKEQTPEICLEAVKQYAYAIRYVKEQTPKLCLEAVKRDKDAIQYVEEQTPELCLEAVKRDGFVLKYVKEQTPELCLKAVKQWGYVLEYVKEQTPEICLEAVKRHGKALEYVKEQTLEICLEAVKQNKDALMYVETKFKDACLNAIEQVESTVANDTTKEDLLSKGADFLGL